MKFKNSGSEKELEEPFGENQNCQWSKFNFMAYQPYVYDNDLASICEIRPVTTSDSPNSDQKSRCSL